MRTLHVVEPWSPPGPLSGSSDRARHGDMAILACRGVVDSGDPDEQTILVLGGSKAGRRAAALGLVGFERIAPPLGRVELAHRSIARWLETRAPFQRAILWNGPNAGPWRHVAQDIVAFDPVTGGAGENAASLPADVATPDGVSRLRALRRDARTALAWQTPTSVSACWATRPILPTPPTLRSSPPCCARRGDRWRGCWARAASTPGAR